MPIGQGDIGLTSGRGISEAVDYSLTNPPFNNYPTRLPVDNKLQRGYMRLLLDNRGPTGGVSPDANSADSGTSSERVPPAPPMTKLNFQFNPNQLRRDVQARADTQLWINQSPEQLLMPGIGDMTFSWQMLFNREAEVMQNPPGFFTTDEAENRVSGAQHPLDALLLNLSDSSNVQHSTTEEFAQRLGVLADIMVLDSITGQRISHEFYEYAKSYATYQATTLYDEEEDDSGTAVLVDDSMQNDMLNMNIGNSAFLIPHPVRCVFSENFMVDGYINSVSVNLLKFSPDMIPTVGMVDISMHALYQGFARKNTFMTQAVDRIMDPDGSNLTEAQEVEVESIIDEVKGIGSDYTDYGATEMQSTAGMEFVFSGIDHSPEAEREEAKLNDFNATGANYTANGSAPMKKGKEGERAMTFQPVSSLLNSKWGVSQMGKANSETFDDSIVQNNVDDFTFHYDIGLSIRARLSVEEKAGDHTDDATSLAALWTDGDNSGFGSYKTDHHFFGNWPKQTRRLLFNEGIDFAADPKYSGYSLSPEAKSLKNVDPKEYTRSFPILELRSDAGAYGDEIRIKEDDFKVTARPISFENTTGVIGGHLYADQQIEIWPEEYTVNLAKGFHPNPANASNLTAMGGHPFVEFLTLEDKDGNTANNIKFKIWYQYCTTVRYVTKHKDTGRTVDDTGRIYVHGMSESTNLVDSAKSEQPLLWTAGKIQGKEITTDNKGKGDKNGWLEYGKIDEDLHFDYIGGLDSNQKLTMEPNYHTMVPASAGTNDDKRLKGYSIARDGIRWYGG